MSTGPIPQYIIKSGLAYFDPNGKNIIPAPVNLTKRVFEEEGREGAHDEESLLSTGTRQKNSKETSGGSLKKKGSRLVDGRREDGESEEERRKRVESNPHSTIYDLYPHEILLKFWNIEYGEQADFLGYARIPMEVLLRPPKGARSFQLESDPQFVKPGAEKIYLHGSVFVKITPVKFCDVRLRIPENAVDPHQLLLEKRAQMRSNRRAVLIDHASVNSAPISEPEKSLGAASSIAPVKVPAIEDDVENYYLPTLWRLHIYRATKMTAMHPIDKNSTICEVCWKGGAKKYDEKIYSDGFLTIGETSVRSNTVDPDWRNDPSAVFELPPVWTDRPLPNQHTRALQTNGTRGGWIAKNHLEELERRDQDQDSVRTNGPVKPSDTISQALAITLPEEDSSATKETGNGDSPKEMTGKLRFQVAANKVLVATRLGKHTIDELEVSCSSLSLS